MYQSWGILIPKLSKCFPYLHLKEKKWTELSTQKVAKIETNPEENAEVTMIKAEKEIRVTIEQVKKLQSCFWRRDGDKYFSQIQSI